MADHGEAKRSGHGEVYHAPRRCPPAALAAYTATRRRDLDHYQRATRALTPLFQRDSRVLGWLRDLTFPISRWLPPLRRRMVRTMAGLDRGIVRRPIPLDELRRLALPAGVPAPANG